MRSGWSRNRMSCLYKRRSEIGRPDLPLLSVYRDLGILLRADRDDNYNRPGDDLSKYQVVRRGDLVLNKMKTWQGSIGISDYEGIVSPAYFVCEQIGEIYPRFAHHLLRSRPLIGEYAARSKGVRPAQWDLPWDEFRTIEVSLPLPDVQHAIADFLDSETARLDRVIDLRITQLRLLRARQQAEIDNVTAWSSHACSLKRLAPFVTSGPRGWADRVVPSGIPFIRIGNLQRDSIDLDLSDVVHVEATDDSEAARSRVHQGDVLVSITADIGTVGIASDEVEGACVSQHVAIVRPENCQPEWLAFVLKSGPVHSQLQAAQYGGTKQQLALDDLRELRIPLADKSAQAAAADRLLRAADGYESLDARILDVIRLLQERRQGLIAAAVTGQIPIPGVAA